MTLHSMPSAFSRRQAGFGLVAAMVVLVLLTVLGAAIVRLTWTQQISSAQDLESTRAQRAANSGAEWGLFQAMKGTWSACAGGSQTLDLRTDLGMMVTITCTSASYVEGQSSASGGAPSDLPSEALRTVRVYVIDAVACNSTTSCPDNSRVTSPAYVERRRQVKAVDRSNDEI